MSKIGLVLSGGGTRGYAHMGVIQALKEKGIEPDIISGVSAGAIAGLFLAAGYEPYDIFQRLKNKGILNYTKVHLQKYGLLTLQGLSHELKNFISEENLEELEKPLYVAASDLTEGSLTYFNKGPIEKIIMASASIPVLFSPVKINGSLYVDGGLFDNLPVTPIRQECDHVIAVNICPTHSNKKIDNIIDIAARTFHLSVSANTSKGKELCDTYIEPEGIHNFHIVQDNDSEELFELGYSYTKSMTINGLE